MKTFRKLYEYINKKTDVTITEGLFQKSMDWMIKNTSTFEEIYINSQQKYGAKTFVIERPINNIKFIKVKNKYSYFSVKYKNKDILCIMKDEYDTDFKEYISDNAPVALTLVELSKLENNGITPYFIKKIKEA